MKFHIKSGLIFLLITLILLVGMTAISASDAVDSETQDNIEHTEVSTTTTTTSMAKSSVYETVKNDINLKEKETTIEKVNNTKTINKTNTTRSSNNAVKTAERNQPVTICGRTWAPANITYVSFDAHNNSYNWDTESVIEEYGSGTYDDPTNIYKALTLVKANGLILLQAKDGLSETVYETRKNAPWVDSGGSFHPVAGIYNFTIAGEDGVVWSGLKENTNMFSLSSMYNATLMNIIFRDGNASGLPRGQGYGPTASVGGAIDNRGNLTVINCTFDRIYANEFGGAIANYEQAHTIIENCTFKNILSTNSTNEENTNKHWGGAISLIKNQTVVPEVTVRNSNFSNITADNGGVFSNDNGIFKVENVTIVDAHATKEGGIVLNFNGGQMNITIHT